MTIRTTKTSKKFAKALFELLKPEEIEAVNEQLKKASDTFVSKSELLLALVDPRYTLSDRLHVVETVLEKSGANNIKTVNLIKTLTESRNLSELQAIAEYFDRLVQALKKSLHVEVISAFPVKAEEIENLKSSITKKYAGLATITTEIDKTLIGGMQVKVGDNVFDSSVKGALEKVGASLSAGN
jgi:F-type H+-transporting ATPase subunit delta